MRLAFVFIEELNIIHQKLFSFDNQFIYDLSPGKNLGEYHLVVHENPHYVNVFPWHILNVTGLVGKNGSGKSTVINCLKLLFGEDHYGTDDFRNHQ
jgi:AAA15 family ATPase/GTPase